MHILILIGGGVIKLVNCKIENAEITMYRYGREEEMRIEFDIRSNIGIFHYDSEYVPCDAVKDILSQLGLVWDIGITELNKLQCSIDFSISYGRCINEDNTHGLLLSGG